jgi:hypothetical protein
MKSKGTTMTKQDAKEKFDLAAMLKQTQFSKLGLICANFLREFKDEVDELTDELFFTTHEFALKDEKGQYVRDDKGTVKLDDTLTKDRVNAIKAWQKQEISIDWSRFKPVKMDVTIPFEYYIALNGVIFNMDEEAFLKNMEDTLAKEIASRNEAKA